MNKKKNKKTSEMLPLNNPTLSEAQCGEQRGDSLASACDEGADFADLQPLFDAQSRRLDDLLCRPEARPASLNTRHSRTFRTRMFYAWGILAIYCVAAAIYWGISLWHYQFDIYFRIYTLFLEGCFLFLAVDTVSTTLAILRHDPASTPFDRMLRYSRRFGMRPLYLPRKKSRLATLIAHLRARRRTTIIPQSVFNFQFSTSNFSRTATIGIAASFTLILVSCAPTVGDGHTLTQNHPARIEAVENVSNIVNNI
ncbi:MAG: hypothetical protein KBT45_07750 [Bacteroidales bacterium]|nr:hypothetical protein [Candidatus Colimorpha pelethequi]